MPIYIPHNLDFELIHYIAQTLNVHADHVLMFVNEIVNARFRARRKVRRNLDSWLPLCQRFLFQRVHHNYTTVRQIKKLLMYYDVIECDNTYCPGAKCYGFRLSSQHRGQKIVAHLPTNKSIKKKLGQVHDFNLNQKVHQVILNHLTQIEINYEKACKYLEDHDVDGHDLKYQAVEKLHNKDWYFVVDEQGRVHHNITNLWGAAKQFLSVQGVHLVSSDIKNSQPLFSSISILLYYNAQGFDLEPDVKKFIRLTEEGELYDWLIEETGFRGSRKKFKHRFFAEIFYSRLTTKTKLSEKFSFLFPNVFKVICHLKKNSHRDFALDMQRAEANLIINKVGSRLAEENIFFSTIHDCILSKPKDKLRVEEIIKEEFYKIGLTPTIK